MKSRSRVEFGDFQTPYGLAEQACWAIARLGVTPSAVIEPTCGIGAFLCAAGRQFPRARLLGWDINPGHIATASAALSLAGFQGRSAVATADFFQQDWDAVVQTIDGPVLVVGNPPWVTNSALSTIRGTNLPTKTNLKGLRGIEALTGKANFDISEWMLLRLLHALRRREGWVAMLCKTSTARRVLQHAWQAAFPIATASMRRIDSRAHFKVAVDACLFTATTGSPGSPVADVFDDLDSSQPRSTLGLDGRNVVPNLPAFRRLRHLTGPCPYTWRSGIKHDCADVMELVQDVPHGLTNGLGESVDIEPDRVFPLLKCSDLANGRLVPKRFLVVPQSLVGEDTRPLALSSPQTWSYLGNHRARLAARRSSIYSGQPPFSVFGVGAYSFAPWKIGVSGLHASARFAVIGPFNDRPVVFDDTCYFIPFQTEGEARIVERLLLSDPCQELIHAMAFDDSKRPITAEILQRINVAAIAEACGLRRQWDASRHASDAQRSLVPTQSEWDFACP